MEKKESFRCGKQSVKLPYPVYIHSSASVVGTKEGEGSLKDLFDIIYLVGDEWIYDPGAKSCLSVNQESA